MRIAEPTSASDMNGNVLMNVDHHQNSVNSIESTGILTNYNQNTNGNNRSSSGHVNGDCCDMVDSDRGCWPSGSPHSAHSSGSTTTGATTPALSSSSVPPNGGVNGFATPSSVDAEGVWSQDIDSAFHEALVAYPPCGRRKIILTDEGKMYGRNELIARYIKVRTGKTRTRKQVSSHIQVLARKKNRESQAKIKDQTAKEKSLQALQAMSGVEAAVDPLSSTTPSAAPPSSAKFAADAMAALSVAANVYGSGGGCGVSFTSTTASPSTALGGICSANLPSTAHPLPRGNVAAADVNWSQAASLAAAARAATAAGRFSQHTPLTVPTLGNPLTISATSALDVRPSFTHLSPFFSLAALQQQHQLQHPHAARPQPAALPPSAFSSLPMSAPPPWQGRSICTPKIRLCEFSAYCLLTPKDYKKRHEIVCIPDDITHADPLLEEIDISQIFDKFPAGPEGLRELYRRGPQNAFFLVKFWADISFNVIDEQSTVFAVDSSYESTENMTITVSTTACSFGEPIVEKVEHEYAKPENGRFVYRMQRSPLCEYMNNFILKLKTLPQRHLMNSVLENFTILQLVTSKETQEVLLCIAIVLEVSESEGSQQRLYKLTYGNAHDPNRNGNDR